MNGIQDKNFFHSLLVYLILFRLKIILESGFLIFKIFILFFSDFSCPGRVWTEFGTKFFFSFLAYLIPFWLKIMAERGYFIFELFCYFFPNFLSQVEYERNLGLNFFSQIHNLSHPGFYRNSVGMMFFNFFNIFFGIFLPGSSMKGICD